jgi:MraZ protein
LAITKAAWLSQATSFSPQPLRRFRGVLGEYSGTIDEKRRISLPSKLRVRLNLASKKQELHLARGLDGCLWLLTPDQWQVVESSLGELSKESFGFGSKKGRAFLREFYRRTAQVQLDSQSRVMLPEPLMKLTGMQKDVIFIVLPDRTEVWAAENDPLCEDYEETAEKLFG